MASGYVSPAERFPNGGRCRRAIERIRMAPALPGQLGSMAVGILDVSLTGAGIEHASPLQVGAAMRLSFRWEGDEIALPCTVIRSRLVGFAAGSEKKLYASGLSFDRKGLGSEHPVRRMIEGSVRRALEAQVSNARGIRLRNEEAPPRFETGFCCFRLQDGRWRKAKTQNPMQPPEGFTVPASEDPDQLELLCKLYERCEDPLKHMIRILAQLSVEEGSDESPRRYLP